MLMWLESVDYLSLWITFFILFVLSLWVGNKADVHLKNKKEFPYGKPMAAFEKAGDVKKALDILNAAKEADDSNDNEIRNKYRTALGWDFLFIFIYPLCGIVGCLLVIKFLAAHDWGVSSTGITIGFVLITLLPVAAALDAVEDYALLRVLRVPVEDQWPKIARWCALPKFGIVYAAIGYEILGVVAWVVSRLLNR